MGDRILAGGIDIIGAWVPIQLWAGEPNGVTTQGVASAGYTFGQLNSRGETYKFPIVAFGAAGELVPWNPLLSDNYDDYATGTVTFSTAVPTAGETVTINGDVFTFAALADVNTPYEVAIGATLTETATNLKAAINAHQNDFSVDGGVTATSAAGVVTVRSPGTAGNAVTLAEAGANIAVGAGTLAGGTDSDAEIGGPALPVGILPHALDTTATGYNADVDTPYFIQGNFNFDQLDVPTGVDYAQLKRAFARSPINVQKLY